MKWAETIILTVQKKKKKKCMVISDKVWGKNAYRPYTSVHVALKCINHVNSLFIIYMACLLRVIMNPSGN